MREIYVKELFRNSQEYADKTITVKGWVRTNRGSNHFGFIELNDGTFFKPVQVVYEEEKLDDFKAGIGLGLSLSRKLAEQLGGNVELDTTYKDGARFIVTLPTTGNAN